MEFACEWNMSANEYSIFYKTAEHVKDYDNKWNDRRTFCNTVRKYVHVLEEVHDMVQA